MCVCVYTCLYDRSKDLIVRAINANDFLKNLEKVQVTEIVECMFPVEFKQDQFICREGAVGTELYVITGLDINVVSVILLMLSFTNRWRS